MFELSVARTSLVSGWLLTDERKPVVCREPSHADFPFMSHSLLMQIGMTCGSSLMSGGI